MNKKDKMVQENTEKKVRLISWRWSSCVPEEKKKVKKMTMIAAAVIAAVFIGLFCGGCFFEAFSREALGCIAGAGVVGLLCILISCNPRKRIGKIFCTMIRLLLALGIPAAVFFLVEGLTHELDTLVKNAIWINLILYYVIYALILAISGKLWISTVFCTLFFAVCGIANYFVISFRSAPIVPWDFYSLGTAMSVADNYTFSFDNRFAVICSFIVAILLYAVRLRKHPQKAVQAEADAKTKKHFVKKWQLRAALTAIMVGVCGYLCAFLWDPETPDKMELYDSLWVSSTMYKNDGFFLSFMLYLRYLNISAPDGYHEKEIEEFLASQEPEETELLAENPNVIVIMSETFSDPAVIGNFNANKDYMPFVHRLMEGEENTISGYVYVSVLGGNTANSEFEFLTGNSMNYFPTGSVPYQQYIHSDVSSMVEMFRDLGYQTTAMHPYNSGGWNRNKVYPFMHFDTMLFKKNLQYVDKLRNYVSDESDYKNVMSLIEKTEEPLFLHNVTMQNHSAYGNDYDNFHPQIAAAFKNTKSSKYLDKYLSLMYETDIATENLIHQLSESDEPTIVVFFGDHQPNDYVVKPVYKEHGLDIDNQTMEQQQKRQMTPFFIWANFDIEEQTDVHTSTNFLGNLLLKAAGFRLDEYRTYLESVQETIPVMNAIGFFDKDGNCRSYDSATPEEQAVLDMYGKVQYYYMFDKNKS